MISFTGTWNEEDVRRQQSTLFEGWNQGSLFCLSIAMSWVNPRIDTYLNFKLSEERAVIWDYSDAFKRTLGDFSVQHVAVVWWFCPDIGSSGDRFSCNDSSFCILIYIYIEERRCECWLGWFHSSQRARSANISSSWYTR